MSSNQNLSRTKSIQEQKKMTNRHRNFMRASVEERLVIRTWNRNEYIVNNQRSGLKESRNQPVVFKDIAAMLPLIRKAIHIIGFTDIIESVEIYFRFCSEGGHIWQRTNHGFKNLSGFLYKLLALKKDRQRAWWDVKESVDNILSAQKKNNKLATRIANSFARTFLNQEKYEFSNGGSEFMNFINTAKQMQMLINHYGARNIVLTERDVIKHLLQCMVELHSNKSETVYIGHLSSLSTWNAILPQYLKEKGIV